jgi:hypothetical protein
MMIPPMNKRNSSYLTAASHSTDQTSPADAVIYMKYKIKQQLKYSTHLIFRKYASTIPRQFGVRYNPYTQSIELLDSKPQIEGLVENINHEIQILLDALRKL